MKNTIKSIIAIGFASILLVNCGGDSSTTPNTNTNGTNPDGTIIASGTATFSGAGANTILTGTTFTANKALFLKTTLADGSTVLRLQFFAQENTSTVETTIVYTETTNASTGVTGKGLQVTSTDSTNSSLEAIFTTAAPTTIVYDEAAKTISFTGVSLLGVGAGIPATVTLDGNLAY